MKLIGIKPDRGHKTIDRGNQITERVVPCSPFVAVEWRIVFGIDESAQLLPAGYGKAWGELLRIVRERNEPGPGKVLALVKHHNERRVRDIKVTRRDLGTLDEVSMVPQFTKRF